MEMLLLKVESKPWEEMWEWLSNHPINEGVDNPSLATNMDESWQYMGSFRNNDVVISEFRHRNHPRTNNVYKLSYQHINPISSDSILKSTKL